MNVLLHFPHEGAERPWISARLESLPAQGNTLEITRSDNPDITEGRFRVEEVVHDLEIVNQSIGKPGRTGVKLVLKRM